MSNKALAKIIGDGKIPSYVLDESPFYDNEYAVDTGFPVVNIAYTADYDLGMLPGLTVVGGPSGSFKSLFGIRMVAAYFKKYPDAMCLFYDSEFGTPPEYFMSHGVDMRRVITKTPSTIEALKFDLYNVLKKIERDKHHVIILIDSLSNLASNKELKDAEEGHDAADMGVRAKAIKAFTRLLSIDLVPKGIPCVCVAHTYTPPAAYAKQQVSGGSGIVYNANQIFFTSITQTEEKKETEDIHVNIFVEKSRMVRKGSKFHIRVGRGGIRKYSGLWEIALEGGFITSPKNGFYTVEGDEKNYRRKELDLKEEFWLKLLADERFKKYVKDKYTLSFKGEEDDQTESEEDDEDFEFTEDRGQPTSPKK